SAHRIARQKSCERAAQKQHEQHSDRRHDDARVHLDAHECRARNEKVGEEVAIEPRLIRSDRRGDHRRAGDCDCSLNNEETTRHRVIVIAMAWSWPMHRNPELVLMLSPIHRWIWSNPNRCAHKLLLFSETEIDGGRDI